MSKKFAIYPGSFDPITYGHIDIVRRARQVFDQVYVAVLHNLEKKPLFDNEQRLELIKTVFKDDPGIIVESFQGLLVDYAAQKKCHTLIRGLRALSDFDYEFQISLTNRKLYPEGDTVFFMTDEKHAYLSSSIVKQVAKYKGNVSVFVPPCVEAALKVAYSHE